MYVEVCMYLKIKGLSHLLIGCKLNCDKKVSSSFFGLLFRSFFLSIVSPTDTEIGSLIRGISHVLMMNFFFHRLWINAVELISQCELLANQKIIIIIIRGSSMTQFIAVLLLDI